MAALCLPAIAATSRRAILNASANDDVNDIDSVADELSARHCGQVLTENRVKYVEQDSLAFGGSMLQPSLLATQTGPPGWGLDRIDQYDLPLNQTYAYKTSSGFGVN